MNKVILGGRLTADPELMKTPQGISTTRFSIAVNRRAKEQQTDFINCVAWRQTAENICNYFKKGSSICITGSLQVNRWTDQQNNSRTSYDVSVDDFTFVDSKSESPASSYTGAPAIQTQEATKFEEVASDDELPF